MYSYWDETTYNFASTVPANYGENPFSFTEADVILDGNWLDLCKRFLGDMRTKVGVHNYYLDDSMSIDLGRGATSRLMKSYERVGYMATR